MRSPFAWGLFGLLGCNVVVGSLPDGGGAPGTSTDVEGGPRWTDGGSPEEFVQDGGAVSDLGLDARGGTSPFGRVFFDDFETGTLAHWSNDDARVAVRARDGRSPHGGAWMAETGWNGAVDWTHPEALSSISLEGWPYDREFFIRMWWRLDADVDQRDGAKLMRIGWRDGTSQRPESVFGIWGTDDPRGHVTQAWWASVGSENPFANWCSSGDVGMYDRQWHRVEIYVRHSTISDGQVKVWFDGNMDIASGYGPGDTKCYPYTGVTTNGVRWDTIHLPSNWSNNPGWEHDAANHFYIDDVEIYSDRGQGARGSMSEGTAQVL